MTNPHASEATRGRNDANGGPVDLADLVAYHARGVSDDLRALALTHPHAARAYVVRVLGQRSVLGHPYGGVPRLGPVPLGDRLRAAGLLPRCAPGRATAAPVRPASFSGAPRVGARGPVCSYARRHGCPSGACCVDEPDEPFDFGGAM